MGTGAAAGSVAGPWGAAIGAGVGALGALYGSQQASAQEKAAEDAALAQQQAIQAQLAAIGVPSVQAQQIALQQYPTPSQLAASQVQNVSYNPQQQAVQQQALAQLQGISQAGGMDAQAKSALQDSINRTGVQEQGNAQALQQQAQRRGMAGSGMQMVSQQMNAQNAANQNQNAGLQTAAQAQQRGLQALAQGTNLSQSMGNQDLNLQLQKAQSADAVNKFNTMNNNAVAQQNVGLTNQQEMANKALIQQNYQNQLNKVSAGQGAATNAGNIMMQSGQQQAGTTAAQYQALGGAANAVGQAYNSSASNDLNNQRWNQLFNAQYPNAKPAATDDTAH